MGEKESSGSDPKILTREKASASQTVSIFCFLPLKTQEGISIGRAGRQHQRSSLIFAFLNKAFEKKRNNNKQRNNKILQRYNLLFQHKRDDEDMDRSKHEIGN